jgi:hypothetical protein
MMPVLNEKQRRIFLACEAKEYGPGGISEVSRISKVSRTTIRAGLKELESGDDINVSSDTKYLRVRRTGGGRKHIKETIPNIQKRVQELVEGTTYGNPEKVLSWTTQSLRKIQVAILEKYHIRVSFKTVGTIREDMGYSKQANQKMF